MTIFQSIFQFYQPVNSIRIVMIASSMLIALYTPSTETQGNILNPIVDDYEYVS